MIQQFQVLFHKLQVNQITASLKKCTPKNLRISNLSVHGPPSTDARYYVPAVSCCIKQMTYLCSRIFIMSKGKVLMAMSGGIDSTVAALMLHHDGYEVIGITMKTWDYATSGGNTGKKETGCCNLDSFNDARMAAVQHGFPHFILDIREEFGDFVIENFVDEYLAGRTP